MPRPKLLYRKAASKRLGYTTASLFQLVSTGKLEYMRLPRVFYHKPWPYPITNYRRPKGFTVGSIKALESRRELHRAKAEQVLVLSTLLRKLGAQNALGWPGPYPDDY